MRYNKHRLGEGPKYSRKSCEAQSLSFLSSSQIKKKKARVGGWAWCIFVIPGLGWKQAGPGLSGQPATLLTQHQAMRSSSQTFSPEVHFPAFWQQKQPWNNCLVSIFNILNYIYLLCMCGHVYLSDCMIRGQLWVSLLSFRYVEPRDQTLVLKHVHKFSYLTNCLTSPLVVFF